MKVDLRSDTVTRPTPGMLEAMMNAEVGDDVLGDDPTVIALENKAAAMFGMEAGLYCPSGTMTNQISLRVLTNPGEEIICYKGSHIYLYEAAGFAMNSGCSIRLIDGEDGRITAEDVGNNINPDNEHYPVTSLVSLENTVNKAGGTYYTLDQITRIKEACDKHNLGTHLDGARIFNALAETGESPADFGLHFDTISICLSKGLGAPVGSLVLSSKENIHKARRFRKVMGGGMRQSGYLAAAGIYALDNHVERIVDDHTRARKIESALASKDYVESILPVKTNILIFTLATGISPEKFLEKLAGFGIDALPFGERDVRMITHLDIDDDMLDHVVASLGKISF